MKTKDGIDKTYKCPHCQRLHDTLKAARGCSAPANHLVAEGDLVILGGRKPRHESHGLRGILRVTAVNGQAAFFTQDGFTRAALGYIKRPWDHGTIVHNRLCAWRVHKVEPGLVEFQVEVLDRRLKATRRVLKAVNAMHERAEGAKGTK